jgi:hypothetical protein
MVTDITIIHSVEFSQIAEEGVVEVAVVVVEATRRRNAKARRRRARGAGGE